MVDISNNGIITMHRADTFTAPIEINLNTKFDPEYYDLCEGDYIYFGLMEPNQKFEDAILKKVFDYTDYDKDLEAFLLHFDSEDTEYLVPGTYYYELKLYRAPQNTFNGREAINTFVGKTKLIIME